MNKNCMFFFIPAFPNPEPDTTLIRPKHGLDPEL